MPQHDPWEGPDVNIPREEDLEDLSTHDNLNAAFIVKVTTIPLVTLVVQPVMGGES